MFTVRIANISSKPPVFYGWVIVFISMLLGFLGTGLYSYSNGVFLPSLAESLSGGSRMELAIGFSGVAVISAIISPALGRYVDQRSTRRVMLLGVFAMSTSYLLMSQVQSLWQFYLVVGLGFGLGVSCVGTIPRNRAVIFWFDQWKGRALGIAVLGASFSGVVFPPLVNGLIELYGWRYSYVVFAAGMLLILLPVLFFFMKDRPEEIGEVRDGRHRVDEQPGAADDQPDDAKTWSVKELAKSGYFWSIGGIFGPMACVYYAVMVHLYGHLVDKGLDGAQAALVLSNMALISLVGKPVIGFLADFLGARITIWISLLSQALSLFGFTQADTYWEFALASAAYGFGYSGLSPLKTFALTTSIGSGSLGIASGLLRWVELPLVMLASPLAGFIHDATGSYNNAFLILASFLILGCIGPFFIRSGKRKTSATASLAK